MAPTFEGIPLEIRQEIYSYLLLDQNVTYTAADTIIHSNYETGLFRVCRSVSAESLDYFYSQNTFMVFDTNISWQLPFAIPMHPVTSGWKFKHYILWMEYYVGPQPKIDEKNLPVSLRSYPARATIFDSQSVHGQWQTAIVSTRYLPIIVHSTNYETSFGKDWGMYFGRAVMRLQFCTAGCHIRSRTKRVEKLVLGLHGLRACLCGRKMKTKEKSMDMKRLTVIIQGDLDKSTLLEIEDGILPVIYSLTDLLNLLCSIIDQGDIYLKQGDFTSARGQFEVAYRLAGGLLTRAWHEEILERDLSQTIRNYGISIRLAMSTINSEQGFHAAAISLADAAWQFTLDPTVLYSPEQKASIKLRLGMAMVFDRQYKRASVELSEAVLLEPSIEKDVLGKLHEVATLRCSNFPGHGKSI